MIECFTGDDWHSLNYVFQTYFQLILQEFAFEHVNENEGTKMKMYFIVQTN